MKGSNPGSHYYATRPFTRARRMIAQRTNTTVLMATTLISILINNLEGFVMHLQVTKSRAEPVKNRYCDTLPAGIFRTTTLLSMPRARGRPRRGAAWYAADSQRKRQKKFERAMALASRRRFRKSRRTRSPPMAYVKEITLDDSTQDYPEHLLFTVLDNWNPPACFGKDAITPAPRTKHRPRDTPDEEFTPCFVEEETSEGIEGNIGEPPQETMQKDRQGEHQEEAEAWVEAPLFYTAQNSQDQPLLLHPEHLELIFDIRSMVDDQIFRAIRINQRLDMIYDAHSSTTPRRQCPTCAQVYAILARSGKYEDNYEDTG
jgi:hypothetical protein